MNDEIPEEAEPIPDTHLHRRANGSAIYRGPGRRSAAIAEAEAQSIIRLHYSGLDHVKLVGRWYRIN